MSKNSTSKTIGNQSDTFQSIANTIHRVTSLPVSIWAPDKNKTILRIIAAVGLPTNYVQTASLDLKKPSVTGDAFKKKKIQMVRDISSDPRWCYKQQAKEMNWKSAICVPIEVDSVSIGTISVYGYTERSISDLRHILPDFAKQIELTLEVSKQKEVLQKILDIDAKLQSMSESPKSILQAIVEGACEITNADCAVIYPFDADRGEFYDTGNIASHGLQKKLKVSEKPRSKGGMASYIKQEDEVTLTNIEAEEPVMLTTSPFIKRENIRAFMGIAIKVGSDILGVLYVNFRKPHNFTKQEKNTIRLFAHQASYAVNNARLYQQLGLRVKALSKLHKVAPQLVSISPNPENLDSVLKQIAEGAQSVLGADLVDLYQYNQDEDDFVLPPVQLGKRFKPYKIIDKILEDDAVRVAVKGGIQYIKIAQEDKSLIRPFKIKRPNAPKERFAVREKLQSMASIPLMVGTELVGVLFANYRSPQTFSPQQRELIELFADQAAIAIYNSRLYQQVDSRIRVLGKLHEVGIDLVSMSDIPMGMEKILKRIAKNAQDVLDADLVDLYQYVQSRDRFYLPPIRAGRQNDRTIIKKEIYKDDVIYKIVKGKQPYYTSDSQKDKTLTTPFTVERPDVPSARFVIRENIVSTAAIPLIVGTEVVGVLFANYRRRQAFSNPQRELIELFAQQAAIVIRNGRMFEQRKILQEIAKDITSTLDKDKLLQKTLARSLDLLGCEAGSIALLNKATNQLEFQYAIGKSRYKSVPFGKGLIGTAAKIRKSVRVGNVLKDSRYIRHVAATRSELDVPMLIGNELIGVLNAESTRLDAFDEGSDELAIILAGQAAIAIHNSRLYGESLQRSERLDLVRQVAAAVSSATDIDQILKLAVDGLAKVFDVKQAAVALADETGEFANVRIEYLEAGCVSAMGHRIPLKNNPQIDRILETKRPLIVDDVQNDPIMVRTRDIMAERKTLSLMVVPIIIDDEVVGTIGMDAVGQKRHFTDEEAELAQAIADQTAAAMRIARQLEERLNDIHSLQEITEQMHQGDLNSVLNLIAQKAVEVTGAKYGGIWLLNKTHTSLTFGGLAGEAATKVRPPDLPVDSKSEDSINKQVVLSGKTYLCNIVKKDKFYKKWYEDTQSELTVPLKYQGRVIGTLNVESIVVNGFTDYHRKLLEALAGQAAVVVQNSRLLERLNVLDDIGIELTSGIRLKENEILESIYKKAQQLTGAKDMYIALYDDKTKEIRFVLATRNGERVEIYPRKADMEKRGMTENIIFTRNPILHKTKDAALAWYKQPGHQEFFGDVALSWLGVPMIVGERVLGVIAVWDWEHEHAYDEQDLQVFSSMASQAAIALDNANLYYDVNQKLERRVVALASLNDIGNTLTSGIRLKEEEIINLIFSQTRKLTSAQDLYIALYDEDTGEIRFPLATEKGETIIIPSRKADMQKRGKTEEIIFTRRPILHKTMRETKEWYSQPGHSDFIASRFPPSWLGVPMMVGERILGVIAALDFDHEFAYDELHLEVLLSMASQAAIALDNANLFYNVNQQLEKVNIELQQAREREIFAALGEVAAGLIHKMSNTIGHVPALANRVEKVIDPKEVDAIKKLQKIKEGVSDALEYIGSMGKVLELKEVTKAEADPKLLISDAIRQTKEILDQNGITLEEDYTELPTIYVNSPLIIEVFRNIIHNAAEAMPNGGRLKINGTFDTERITIQILDTGCGILEENKHNLFKLGFSTKKEGKGIGLWFSKTVVEEHQGAISVESETGKGTSFVIRLPVETPAPLDK